VLDRPCETDALRTRRRARIDQLNSERVATGGVTGTLAEAGGALN
jgi:hypothetical protein